MEITLLGGDKRSIKLAHLLIEDNDNLKVFGFEESEVSPLLVSSSLITAITGSNIVIAPLPCSNDDILLNTPFYKGEIKIREIFKAMKKDQVFIGGKISKEIKDIANHYGISTFDIMDREELAILNAIPTVEGGIQIAMEEMDTTIHNSNIMILGFGRIGKLLAKSLKGLGGNVFVEARKHEDLAWIKSYGYHPLHLSKIKNYLPNMDLVFNTIPSMIMDEENLSELKKESLVIDLASKPGGIDFENAKDMGIKVIWALGLPGKVAPKTAAEIIKQSIYNIIEELE